MFVRESRFREDLYYRINAFAIRLPSLRERAVDIPVLANRFLARYCAANGLPLDAKQFSAEAAELLVSYHWPGNIRELESTVVARGAVGAGPVDPADRHRVPARAPARRPAEDAGNPRLPSLRDAERAHIIRVLEAAQLEQGRGGEDPGHQPRHAVPEDRGIRARADGAGRRQARANAANGLESIRSSRACTDHNSVCCSQLALVQFCCG